MKQLYELTEQVSKDDLPEIYCDMDMVLCDFIRGADKAIGEPFVQSDKETRWKKINNTKGFWEGLPWMAGGKQLWNFISMYKPHILSAYVEESFDPNCIPGKTKWLKTNVQVPIDRINLVRRVQKQNFADKNSILIDDYNKNISDFKRRGGIGIYHTSTSNTIRELKKLGF